MKEFLGEDFLLDTKTAKKLYHDFAQPLPIVDYHCHIDPREIAQDTRFENIAQVWLSGDHYKWRMMRAGGVDEYYITGGAPDREKFQKFAEIMPKLIGNPLYHWSHLELKRYFGCDLPLSGESAREIWDLTKEKISGYSAREFIRASNVKLICTTDDPADDLTWHEKLQKDESFETKVLPAWRPDALLSAEKPGFSAYVEKLGKSADVEIESLKDLHTAICRRMDYFAARGCRISDHSFDYLPYCPPESEAEAEKIFKKALKGELKSEAELKKYTTALMLMLAGEYAKRGWAMQIHCGVMRENNSRLNAAAGCNIGCDCMGDHMPISQMARFFDALDRDNRLPKTIVYNLNPTDNARIATVLACFQSAEMPGKMQLGAPWWFCDHKTGLEEQLAVCGNYGMLGNFVGMLTDSRSFLSYTRHEYFRRVLCRVIGGWVEAGEYPADMGQLKTLIEDICYHNAVRYFGFDL